MTKGEFSCPECGSEHDSKMAVSCHYGTAHEGSISGYSTECSQCGESLQVRQKDRLDGNNFCDIDCESAFRSENQFGENHPNYQGGKDVVPCEYCGNDVERWSQEISAQENVFCDFQCQGDWRTENRSGKDNWNYKDGSFEHQYGPDWTEKRKEALIRANYTCEHPECSKTETKPGYSLDVHHIVPRRYWDDVSESNTLDNLIALCRQHHRQIEPPIYNETTRGTTQRRNGSPA